MVNMPKLPELGSIYRGNNKSSPLRQAQGPRPFFCTPDTPPLDWIWARTGACVAQQRYEAKT